VLSEVSSKIVILTVDVVVILSIKKKWVYCVIVHFEVRESHMTDFDEI
jgi:hypothetical protein